MEAEDEKEEAADKDLGKDKLAPTQNGEVKEDGAAEDKSNAVAVAEVKGLDGQNNFKTKGKICVQGYLIHLLFNAMA